MCSHGHPQISASIKNHKSREITNTEKSTRVSQELMVGTEHLRGLFQRK